MTRYDILYTQISHEIYRIQWTEKITNELFFLVDVKMSSIRGVLLMMKMASNQFVSFQLPIL
jgi:hypothetical protein